MTLPAEVVRIVGKDLRVLRWSLAAWSIMLVLSVVRGLDLMPALHEVLYPVTIFVPMMAATLVAYAVTLDPAAEGATFWGVHRHRPHAIALAKTALALLLLGAMSAGQAVVLASHGLSPLQVCWLVAAAAQTTGAWMLCAAALAACARDAKGWLVGGALVGVLALLISAVATDHAGVPMRWLIKGDSASLLLTATSVSVLLWTYRTQLTGIGASLRNAALIVIAAVVLVTPRSSNAGPVDDRPLRRDTTIIVHSDRTVVRVAQRAVVVGVPITYPDSSVVVGVTKSWQLQLRDGSVLDLIASGQRIRRNAKPLDHEQNMALWGRGPVTRVLQFRYPLDSATLARVEGQLSSVTLDLTTNRVLMQRVRSFPVSRGGTVTSEGGRLTLSRAAEDGSIAIAVSSVWVPEHLVTMPSTMWFAAFPMLALSSDDGRDVRVLKLTRDLRDDGARTASWVLPGNEMRGHAASLIPAHDDVAVTGAVVAFGGTYAGRAAQRIQARLAP